MKTTATEKSRSITFVYDSSQFPDLIQWFGGATCRRHFAAFQRPTSRSYKMDLKTTVGLLDFGKMDERDFRIKIQAVKLLWKPRRHLSLCNALDSMVSFILSNISLQPDSEICSWKSRKKRNAPFTGVNDHEQRTSRDLTGWAKLKDIFLPLISVRVSGGGSLAGFISSLAGRWRLSWHRAASVCAVVERYQNCLFSQVQGEFPSTCTRVAAINKKEQKKTKTCLQRPVH